MLDTKLQVKDTVSVVALKEYTSETELWCARIILFDEKKNTLLMRFVLNFTQKDYL